MAEILGVQKTIESVTIKLTKDELECLIECLGPTSYSERLKFMSKQAAYSGDKLYTTLKNI